MCVLNVNFAADKNTIMKLIAYGNIAQHNEDKELIVDTLRKMNCPVFIETEIDNRREKGNTDI